MPPLAPHSTPLNQQPQWQATLRYVLVLLLVLQALGPFIWILFTALKGPDEPVFGGPLLGLPQQPSLQNFATVWQKLPFLQFGLNSFMVSSIATLFNNSTSLLSAYALARLPFKGKNLVFAFVLASMMLPLQVTMIPLFLLVLGLGLTEGHGPLALWLGLAFPFCVSSLGTMLLRQAIVDLPIALEEAAILEGASPLALLWQVVVPALRPTLITIALFSMLGTWGEFLWPSLLVNEPQHMTLPLGLVQLQSQFSSNWRWISAGTLMNLVPSLVFFMVCHRYLLPTKVGSAVKG